MSQKKQVNNIGLRRTTLGQSTDSPATLQLKRVAEVSKVGCLPGTKFNQKLHPRETPKNPVAANYFYQTLEIKDSYQP